MESPILPSATDATVKPFTSFSFPLRPNINNKIRSRATLDQFFLRMKRGSGYGENLSTETRCRPCCWRSGLFLLVYPLFYCIRPCATVRTMAVHELLEESQRPLQPRGGKVKLTGDVAILKTAKPSLTANFNVWDKNTTKDLFGGLTTEIQSALLIALFVRFKREKVFNSNFQNHDDCGWD